MLRRYLPSVVNHTTLPDCEIIVADNGSTDDSLEVLRKEFPSVKTIVLDKNYGFAEGYNRAIEQVDSNEPALKNEKFIQDGQLFIRCGEQVFDVQGRRVK